MASLTCLQLLAKWDPKSLHQLWLTLLRQQSVASATARHSHPSLLDVLVGDTSSKVGLAFGEWSMTMVMLEAILQHEARATVDITSHHPALSLQPAHIRLTQKNDICHACGHKSKEKLR